MNKFTQFFFSGYYLHVMYGKMDILNMKLFTLEQISIAKKPTWL